MGLRCDARTAGSRVRGGGVVIREMTAYQIVCDHCGSTAYDMDATMADFFAGGGGGIPEPTYAGATVRDANGRLWEAAA